MADRIDPAGIFNLTIPDEVMKAVNGSKVTLTAAQVRTAFEGSPLKHIQCLTLDNGFDALPEKVWTLVLPHVGTNRLRYEKPDWVCREFSGLFQVVCAGVLGVDAVARVLDFNGHHAYNALACAEPDGIVNIRIVEPQTDEIVPKLGGHYLAVRGLALWG